MHYDLKGKVAIVTGASSKRGMARFVALDLAENGADVVVTDVASYGVRGASKDDVEEEWHGLDSVVAEIEAKGCRSLAVIADITKPEQVNTLVEKTVEKFGKIDILINAAGIIGPRMVPVLDIPTEEWQKLFNVNIFGTYNCAKAVAKQMIKQGNGGKIVNFASVDGKRVAREGFGGYNVSKFGVIGLTQVLAFELAKYKINVNAVCPGIIATEISGGAKIRSMLKSGMTLQEAVNACWPPEYLSSIAIGRVALPEEIAPLVTFLASPAADYMTGQSINFDGGMLMCH
jgi:meso-butanediol dehydrogenase/(S,S)-butanediol dehydrogenase/diacetyl reductase